MDQVDIQFRVELVTGVFLETLQDPRLLEVLSDDADNSFLHFFFQNMVFALGVDLIQEFFFALFISLICLLLAHWDFALGL